MWVEVNWARICSEVVGMKGERRMAIVVIWSTSGRRVSVSSSPLRTQGFEVSMLWSAALMRGPDIIESFV